MELTSMFLNQLTGNNGIERFSASTSNKGFEQILNNVETKKGTDKYKQNLKKQDNGINPKSNDKYSSNNKNKDQKIENKNFSKENKKIQNKSSNNKEEIGRAHV